MFPIKYSLLRKEEINTVHEDVKTILVCLAFQFFCQFCRLFPCFTIVKSYYQVLESIKQLTSTITAMIIKRKRLSHCQKTIAFASLPREHR